jgi:hypothetical protein
MTSLVSLQLLLVMSVTTLIFVFSCNSFLLMRWHLILTLQIYMFIPMRSVLKNTINTSYEETEGL